MKMLVYTYVVALCTSMKHGLCWIKPPCPEFDAELHDKGSIPNAEYFSCWALGAGKQVWQQVVDMYADLNQLEDAKLCCKEAIALLGPHHHVSLNCSARVLEVSSLSTILRAKHKRLHVYNVLVLPNSWKPTHR